MSKEKIFTYKLFQACSDIDFLQYFVTLIFFQVFNTSTKHTSCEQVPNLKNVVTTFFIFDLIPSLTWRKLLIEIAEDFFPCSSYLSHNTKDVKRERNQFTKHGSYHLSNLQRFDTCFRLYKLLFGKLTDLQSCVQILL